MKIITVSRHKNINFVGPFHLDCFIDVFKDVLLSQDSFSSILNNFEVKYTNCKRIVIRTNKSEN